MKRFVLACLLALPLMAASQQEAKAWCKICISGSFHISCQSSGHHICICCTSPPPCDAHADASYGYYGGGYDGYAAAGSGYGYAYAGYNGYAYPGYNASGYAAAPAAAPETVVPAAWSAGYYGAAAGYGYYPSYGYGR